jgi:hypothetical protein
MTEYTPDPALVELVMFALAREDVQWGYDHGFATTTPDRSPETAAFARAVLAVLAEAGRLLPSGGRVREERRALGTDLHWSRRTVVDWPDGGRYVGSWSPVSAEQATEPK